MEVIILITPALPFWEAFFTARNKVAHCTQDNLQNFGAFLAVLGAETPSSQGQMVVQQIDVKITTSASDKAMASGRITGVASRTPGQNRFFKHLSSAKM
jgi:hypothetical protein